MKFGCHCSSARCRRLSFVRWTLFGIFSLVAIVLMARSLGSGATKIEYRALRRAVFGECAFLTDRVRALENPVLPGAQTAKNLRFERLGAGEAKEIGRAHV